MKLFGLSAAIGAVLLLAGCAGEPDAAASALVSAAPADPVPSAQEPAKPSVESLTIVFDKANATLSPAAMAQLDGAARLYRDARPEIMTVAGHSDKDGQEYENLILSARRANLVKRALVDRGIPAERLQIIAIGEAEVAVGVPATRSAVVTWR